MAVHAPFMSHAHTHNTQAEHAQHARTGTRTFDLFPLRRRAQVLMRMRARVGINAEGAAGAGRYKADDGLKGKGNLPVFLAVRQ